LKEKIVFLPKTADQITETDIQEKVGIVSLGSIGVYTYRSSKCSDEELIIALPKIFFMVL
jgi:hypothetical protein